MNTYTVYKITCKINNKSYIGYTKKKIELRLKEHFSRANKIKTKFYNAILKYGKINFTTEAIFTSNNQEEALLKEIFYIKEYNTLKKGYNSNEGGISGNNRIVSEKTKKLISENHHDVSGEKNPFYNKKHSEDSKKKIGNREYAKGNNHHFFNKIMKTSFKEGKEHPKAQSIIINGVEYGSLRLAAKAFGVSRDKIKRMYLN